MGDNILDMCSEVRRCDAAALALAQTGGFEQPRIGWYIFGKAPCYFSSNRQAAHDQRYCLPRRYDGNRLAGFSAQSRVPRANSPLGSEAQSCFGIPAFEGFIAMPAGRATYAPGRPASFSPQFLPLLFSGNSSSRGGNTGDNDGGGSGDGDEHIQPPPPPRPSPAAAAKG